MHIPATTLPTEETIMISIASYLKLDTKNSVSVKLKLGM